MAPCPTGPPATPANVAASASGTRASLRAALVLLPGFIPPSCLIRSQYLDSRLQLGMQEIRTAQIVLCIFSRRNGVEYSSNGREPLTV